MIDASVDPVKFDEAIAWFVGKLALTKDEWEELTTAARRKAFTVANVAQAELVQGVKDSLARALGEGQNFRTWKEQIGPALEEAWGGDRPWHLETVFRTNVQSAYSAGRYAQLTDDDVIEARPYWMYDAILDGRTTDACTAMHGTVAKADDPWWQGRVPPLHFNCRSSLRSLAPDQAKAQPGFSRQLPATKGEQGFGDKPGASEWEPSLDKYDDGLRQALKTRLAHGPDESRMPALDMP